MIRPAHAGDVDALVRLEHDSFDVYPISRARFARLVGHASRPLLVCEDADGSLLAAAAHAARSLGCTPIRLEVDETNAAARALHRSAGCECARTAPDGYGPGRSAVVHRRYLR